MAFLRYYVSAVVVLHAAILFTTLLSLFSGWRFLGMVNCQSGSSYLADMDAVDYSAPSAFENDFVGIQAQGINECCKKCQNEESGCVQNCNACEVVKPASFFKKLFKSMPAVHKPYHSNRFARENHYPATLPKYPRNDQNPNVMHSYRSDYQNPNVMYPYTSSRPFRRCCADCVDGDIYCLSSCEKYQCKPTAVCATAGPGAYSSFCQRECADDDQLTGFSAAMTTTFLPDKACRANCAKYVQQMCARNQCRDYGCVANNCASLAVGICG